VHPLALARRLQELHAEIDVLKAEVAGLKERCAAMKC
jgi:cell division protein FtsB